MKITCKNGDVLEGTALELAEYRMSVQKKQPQQFQMVISPLYIVSADWAKEDEESENNKSNKNFN